MVVIVQNDPIVPAGLIGTVLGERGVRWRLFRVFDGEGVPDTCHAEAVVVLGGTMSVCDTLEYPYLDHVRRVIRQTIEKSIPYLGICLGGQLLAEVLDAKVHRGSRGERGCCRISLTPEGKTDPLFGSMPENFLSFQWHNDSFDVPRGGLVLARTETCPYQAFRWNANAYGIQFHPEVDRSIVACWSGGGKESPNSCEKDFSVLEAEYTSTSRIFLENFFALPPNFHQPWAHNPL
ncbi:MAG: type 1 glutamine amidotransferase [Syntrophobacteraceae bacterium]|nr:type 1 glutamine amidotransferase [Syntrophobacteraceae bacterium]